MISVYWIVVLRIARPDWLLGSSIPESGHGKVFQIVQARLITGIINTRIWSCQSFFRLFTGGPYSLTLSCLGVVVKDWTWTVKIPLFLYFDKCNFMLTRHRSCQRRFITATHEFSIVIVCSCMILFILIQITTTLPHQPSQKDLIKLFKNKGGR